MVALTAIKLEDILCSRHLSGKIEALTAFNRKKAALTAFVWKKIGFNGVLLPKNINLKGVYPEK